MAETEAPQVSPHKEEKEKKVLISGVTGTVKWFSLYSGYGFINRDDDSSDVFVHHSSIAEKTSEKHFSSLAEGEKVKFDVVQGDKGLEAAHVTGPDGGAVQGHKFTGRRSAGRGRGKGRVGGRGRNAAATGDSPNQEGSGAEHSTSASPKKKVEIPKGEKVASGITGKVKWFAARKGYGFISRDDNEEDVFVHHSSFAKQTTSNYRPAVRENDALLFDVMKGEKGYLADNVTQASGEPVENLKLTNRRLKRSARGKGRNASGGSPRRVSENESHKDHEGKDEKPHKDDDAPPKGRGRGPRRGGSRGGRGGMTFPPGPRGGGYEDEGYGYGYRQPRFYSGERIRGGRGGYGYGGGFFPGPRYYDNYGPGPMMRGGPRGRGGRGRGAPRHEEE